MLAGDVTDIVWRIKTVTVKRDYTSRLRIFPNSVKIQITARVLKREFNTRKVRIAI